MMKSLFLFPILLLFSFQISPSQEYRAVPLIHPAGNLFVSGLNNQGQVCGTVLVDDVNFFNNAVRFEPDGTFKTLSLGDLGQSSTASAINDFGHVLGTVSRSDFTTAIVIWESDSTYRELEQPDGFASVLPQDLNNKGEAVGYIFNFGGANEAIFWDSDGVLEKLSQPEGGAEVRALNDSTVLVGFTSDEDGNHHAVRWDQTQSRSARKAEFQRTPIFGDDRIGEALFITNWNSVGGWFLMGDRFAYIITDQGDLQSTRGEDIFGLNVFDDCNALLENDLGSLTPQIKIGEDSKTTSLLSNIIPDIVSASLMNDNNAQVANDVSSQKFLILRNYTIKLQSDVSAGSGVLGLNPFKTWSEVEALLAGNGGSPIDPLILHLGGGIHNPIDIKPTISTRIEFRLDDYESREIEEVAVGEDIDLIVRSNLASSSYRDFTFRGNKLTLQGEIDAENFSLTGVKWQQTLVEGDGFNVSNAFINNLGSTLKGRIRVNFKLDWKEGNILRGEDAAIINIENGVPDQIMIGHNLPVGPISMTSPNVFDGRLERVIDPNSWTNGDNNDRFYSFPTAPAALIGELFGHIHIQLADGDFVNIPARFGVQPIDETDFLMPLPSSDGLEYDTPPIAAFSVEVNTLPFASGRHSDIVPVMVNLRTPIFGSLPDEDPNLYRILQFDCDGVFLGTAGSFIQDTGGLQTSGLYSGYIDGVLNISHANVALDSCNYLVLVKGEMITSTWDNSGISEGFLFKNLYPNPTTEAAYVEFSIPVASAVNATLYNLVGQAVWSENHDRIEEGEYHVPLEHLSNKDLTPGIYYCQLEFSDPYGSDFHYVQTKKLILIE